MPCKAFESRAAAREPPYAAALFLYAVCGSAVPGISPEITRAALSLRSICGWQYGRAYPQTVPREFRGLAHAELVLMQPERFYREVTRFLQEGS